MPLYDYKCLACGTLFEALVLPQLKPPACPDCGKKKLEQQLSSFRVNSENTRDATVRAGKTQNEKLRREHKMNQIAAEKAARDHHH